MRVVGLILLLVLPMAVLAQTRDETLADIKAEISALSADIAGLRQELAATGVAGGTAAGGSPLQRMDAIEAELVRLTGKTEALENRINQVASDGTLRLGDLQFRVTELEGGDPAAAGPAKPLGEAATVVPDAPVPDTQQTDTTGSATPSADMAVNEQADFDRAKAALDSGSFRSAADLFATFAQSYPGGTLTAEAQYNRGEALAALGDTQEAARAYLESFSGAPSGTVAADALFKLGLSLSQLGQMQEACVTLNEVGARFPGAIASEQAGREIQALQCQ